jgi:hypothetical protein
MKAYLTAVVALLLLNSCVFEAPFESEAKIPLDSKLLGRWEQVKDNPGDSPNRMLVLQHTANEYVVEYPVGEKAMYFRAYGVELEGANYIQVQLIGTAEGPAKPEERKYHLLKVSVEGDALDMRTINADLLGKNLKDSTAMKAAFKAHKADADLFQEPSKFKRLK